MAGSHSLPLFSGPRRTRANIARSCRPLCCACKPGTGVSGDCGLTRDSYSTLGHLINLDTHYTSTIFASSFHVFVSRFGSLFCGFTRYSCFTLGHVYLHAHYFTIFVSSFRAFVFRFWSLFTAKKIQKHSEHVFSKFVQHRWVLRITVAMGCRELLPPYAIHLQQYKSPT